MTGSDRLPARIGPYRVLSRLGQGGACEVLLAEAYGASGFVRRVAIKRLHQAFAAEPELVRALVREAQLGAMLSHRGVVQVWSLGLHEGEYYVVMEWVDGADLATLLDAARPPSPVALAIAAELAAALDVLHRACDAAGRPLGIVHRDLSANNVLLSMEGEVKLADLGLAKATLLADRSRGDARKGTYAYMSPEQVAHEPLTQASDQFSFGVLLAELWTGARPFDREGALATMQAIAEPVLPPWPGLEEARVQILRRALARDPGDRFGDLGQLRAALRGAGAVADASEIAAWVAAARLAASARQGT